MKANSKGNFGEFYPLEIILKGYKDVLKPYDIYFFFLKSRFTSFRNYFKAIKKHS